MAPKRQPALKSPSSDSDSSEELAIAEKQAPIANQLQISDSDEDEESSDEELEDDTNPSTEKSAPTQSDSSNDTSGSDTDSSSTAPSPTASGFKINLIDSKKEKNTNPNSVGTKSTQSPSNSEDGGSGSDTESSDTTAPSPMVSAVTKPMNDLAEKKKPAQNPNAVGTKLAATRDVSAKKLNEKEKGKLLNGAGAMEEKKSPIVRIWSDDDEVAIVQGMLEYRTKKGCDPYADRDAFHEFMKKFLSIEVTKNQLMDKIRRLKSRYENNVKKAKYQVSSKPSVLKLFGLSKKVWGGDGAVAVETSAKNRKRNASQSVSGEALVSKENNGEKSNKKAKKSVEVKKSLDGIDVVEDGLGLNEGFWDAYPHFKEALELENSGYFSKSGQRAMEVQLSKIGAAKAKEMDDKWKGFHVKEAELNLLRSELATEQTKLVLETMKAAIP